MTITVSPTFVTNLTIRLNKSIRQHTLNQILKRRKRRKISGAVATSPMLKVSFLGRWWRVKESRNVVIKQETALQYCRLIGKDKLHPMSYPHT